MEDDYVYAPESVLARVISSEVSEKCCKWFRNARAIFPTNQKRGTCDVHQVGFASWFPTLISCFPNLPCVYIRLCKHGNHFTFLH